MIYFLKIKNNKYKLKKKSLQDNKYSQNLKKYFTKKKKFNKKVFEIKKFFGLKKNFKLKSSAIKKELYKLVRFYKIRNLQKKSLKKKRKKSFKHKYKKPYYKRKIFKKIQTFIYLSYNDLNFYFIPPKYFRVNLIFYLKRMKTWKYLYKEYIQYFFGLSKKTFSKFLNLYIRKKKGLFGVFKFLTKKLNFFSIFNFIKYASNKKIKSRVLYNNIVYSIICKTKLNWFFNKNFLLIFYSKQFFKLLLNLKKRKLRSFFFKKYYKFRLWQRKTLKIYFKILNFFYFIKLKQYWVNLLYYNKNFFFNFKLNILIKNIWIFKRFVIKKKKILKFFFWSLNKLKNFFLKRNTIAYIFYKSKYLWRKKHIKFFKTLQKKVKKIQKTYKSLQLIFLKQSFYFFFIILFKLKQYRLNKIYPKYFKKFLFSNNLSFKHFKQVWLKKKFKKIFLILQKPYKKVQVLKTNFKNFKKKKFKVHTKYKFRILINYWLQLKSQKNLIFKYIFFTQYKQHTKNLYNSNWDILFNISKQNLYPLSLKELNFKKDWIFFSNKNFVFLETLKISIVKVSKNKKFLAIKKLWKIFFNKFYYLFKKKKPYARYSKKSYYKKWYKNNNSKLKKNFKLVKKQEFKNKSWRKNNSKNISFQKTSKKNFKYINKQGFKNNFKDIFQKIQFKKNFKPVNRQELKNNSWSGNNSINKSFQKTTSKKNFKDIFQKIQFKKNFKPINKKV